MTPRRPLIALPARFAASTSALRHSAVVSARALADAVFRAGGEPVMLHPHAPGGTADPVEVTERLRFADGVLLPGGGDLSAHWTGQDPHPSLYDVDEEQDAFDLAVARVALDERLPLLAVCRGLHVINALLGGTLVQDMDEATGEMSHHRHRVHNVTVDPGTSLSQITGHRIRVSCYHHQCLDRVGRGLRVIARAEEGVAEATDLPGHPGWFLGVQWHPEDTAATEHTHQGIFDAHVAACRTRGRP